MQVSWACVRTGKLFDQAIDAVHAHAPVERAFREKLVPWLLVVAAMQVASWACEVQRIYHLLWDSAWHRTP